MAKAKVVLDWKSLSNKAVTDFIMTMDDDIKKEFAKACSEKKDGKNVINKSKAKAWLTSKFDSTGEIEWKNRPKQGRAMSSADIVASWLDL